MTTDTQTSKHNASEPVAGRILVTGATGDIGGHLVTALEERGASYAVMCRRADQRADFRARGIEAVAGRLQ